MFRIGRFADIWVVNHYPRRKRPHRLPDQIVKELGTSLESAVSRREAALYARNFSRQPQFHTFFRRPPQRVRRAFQVGGKQREDLAPALAKTHLYKGVALVLTRGGYAAGCLSHGGSLFRQSTSKIRAAHRAELRCVDALTSAGYVYQACSVYKNQ